MQAAVGGTLHRIVPLPPLLFAIRLGCPPYGLAVDCDDITVLIPFGRLVVRITPVNHISDPVTVPLFQPIRFQGLEEARYRVMRRNALQPAKELPEKLQLAPAEVLNVIPRAASAKNSADGDEYYGLRRVNLTAVYTRVQLGNLQRD